MNKTYKRASIPIVDKRFQFKYTGIILVIAIVISTILGCLLLRGYWEMNRIMDLAMGSPHIAGKVDKETAMHVFNVALAFIVLEVFILGVMGLIITHRVCGPIFVLHRHLTTMLDGMYPVARPLRRKDEFAGTFEVFTRVVESLKRRDAHELEILDQVIAAARNRGMSGSDIAPLEQLVVARKARLGSNP